MKPIAKFYLAVIGLLCVVAFFALVSAASAQDQPVPTPAVTPGTACGERGIGRDPRTYEVLEIERAGLRVGTDGVWTACDRPCTDIPAVVEWTVGSHRCVATDNPWAGRALLHGQDGYWQQWLGTMRGHTIERCIDGVRTVLGAVCAPATHCDSRIEFERDGRRYVYDGVPAAARVPAGLTVQAVAADGRMWPLFCVAGEWTFPLVLPPSPAPSAPRRLVCGPQAFRAISTDTGASDWRYEGPAVASGAVVAVVSADGLRAGRATCLVNGRFALQRGG